MRSFGERVSMAICWRFLIFSLLLREAQAHSGRGRSPWLNLFSGFLAVGTGQRDAHRGKWEDCTGKHFRGDSAQHLFDPSVGTASSHAFPQIREGKSSFVEVSVF